MTSPGKKFTGIIANPLASLTGAAVPGLPFLRVLVEANSMLSLVVVDVASCMTIASVVGCVATNEFGCVCGYTAFI